MKPLSKIGFRYGRLIVLEKIKAKPGSNSKWICQCDCGRGTIVSNPSLTSGDTRSCGCLRSEKLKQIKFKHGMCDTPVYHVWATMLQRCTNPKDKDFADYGGRGITVCRRWSDFRNFYADMGDPPKCAPTLDRENNDRGYNPKNCKWASWSAQAFNRRPKGEGRKARDARN